MRALISMFVLYIARNTLEHIEKYFADLIPSIIQRSEVLLSEFEKTSRRVMSSRRRSTKDIFFSSLGCSTLCVYDAHASGSTFLESQKSAEQVAFSKLFHVSNNSSSRPARDFSFWLLATFNQICEEDVRSNSSEELADNNDKLFRNEPARREYRTFRKLTVHEDTETYILSICWLYASMETVVDSLNTN